MGYQSKTWSLSDEVVAEIERRVELMTRDTGSGSPNRVLKEALFTPYVPKTRQFPTTDPPVRELLVELDGEGGDGDSR